LELKCNKSKENEKKVTKSKKKRTSRKLGSGKLDEQTVAKVQSLTGSNELHSNPFDSI
jgi:hypothetical protein